MKQITLTYPTFFGWRQKVVRTQMAEKWHELEPHQFIAMVRAMNSDIKEDDLLVELLNLPHAIIQKLDMYQRYELGRGLAHLESEVPMNSFIIPAVFGLNPPQDGLRDVSFAEFMHIDTFYMDYIESKSDADLLKLVSCLYVPWVNNKRPIFEDFNPGTALVLDPVMREAIALNYGLVRKWLEKAYPEVFPQRKSTSAPLGEQADKKQNGGWLDVFDGLVGDDIPNKKTYANESCTEILRYMNKKIKSNRKKGK